MRKFLVESEEGIKLEISTISERISELEFELDTLRIKEARLKEKLYGPEKKTVRVRPREGTMLLRTLTVFESRPRHKWTTVELVQALEGENTTPTMMVRSKIRRRVYTLVEQGFVKKLGNGMYKLA